MLPDPDSRLVPFFQPAPVSHLAPSSSLPPLLSVDRNSNALNVCAVVRSFRNPYLICHKAIPSHASIAPTNQVTNDFFIASSYRHVIVSVPCFIDRLPIDNCGRSNLTPSGQNFFMHVNLFILSISVHPVNHALYHNKLPNRGFVTSESHQKATQSCKDSIMTPLPAQAPPHTTLRHIDHNYVA